MVNVAEARRLLDPYLPTPLERQSDGYIAIKIQDFIALLDALSENPRMRSYK